MINQKSKKSGFVTRDPDPMIICAIIGLVTAIVIPAFLQYRKDSRAGKCQNNLRIIEHAKGQWAPPAIRHRYTNVVPVEVNTYIKSGAPSCPDGGVYDYGVIDQDPTCSIGGDHTL